MVEAGKKQAAEEQANQPADPELQKLASLIPGVAATIGATPSKADKKSKKRRVRERSIRWITHVD